MTTLTKSGLAAALSAATVYGGAKILLGGGPLSHGLGALMFGALLSVPIWATSIFSMMWLSEYRRTDFERRKPAIEAAVADGFERATLCLPAADLRVVMILARLNELGSRLDEIEGKLDSVEDSLHR